ECEADQVSPGVAGQAREIAGPRRQEPDMCLHHDFQTNHGDKNPRADGGHMLTTWPATECKKACEKSPHRPARARCEDHCTRGKDRQKGKQPVSFRPPKRDEEGEERS